MTDHSTASARWLRDYARVAAAIAWLDTHRTQQPAIAEVAAAQHLSPGHLHRTFTRFAGVPPHRFLRWLTAGAGPRRRHGAVLARAAARPDGDPGRGHPR